MMKLVWAMVLLGCSTACGDPYDDRGDPDPTNWWSWTCDGGAVAPDGGCPKPASDGGATTDGC